jgi:hypothetical protein
MSQRKHRLLANKTHLQPWLESFKKHQNIEKLERQVVINLIDKIVVHDKDTVTIQFQHDDEMQEMFILSGVLEERCGEEQEVCGL